MRQSTAQVAPRPEIPRADPFEVMRRIRRSGLGFADQALLCAVLDHDRFGRSSAGCTASLETLAGEIGVSSRHVARLLLVLLRAGWLKADPQRGNVRPLRMGKSCTNNHGQTGAAADCTHDKPAPAPRTNGCLHLGQTGALEELGNERSEETAAPALPPDWGSVASEDIPRLNDGREIPGGLGVVGGMTLLEMVKLRGVPDADLIRAGHLRRARTSRPAS